MGKLKMVRVDHRLVHGQASNWIRELQIDKIVIPSGEVKEDPFMIEMFELAAPPGTKIIAYQVEEAADIWKQDQFGKGNIMLLFKYIEDAYEAYRKGLRFTKLNVANVHASPDRTYATSTVHLSRKEARMLIELGEENGVDVYNQAIPMDKVVKLDKLVQKLR